MFSNTRNGQSGHAKPVSSSERSAAVADDHPPSLFLRLYDWALRKRLLSEPHWGQPNFLQRLLRIRLVSALAISLPAIALCAWYSLIALAAHTNQTRVSASNPPLTLELFQLHVHDRLMRDWRRLIMPQPQHDSPLPTYGLAVSTDKLDELDRHTPAEDGLSYYVDGLVIRGSRAHDVLLRYRGNKPAHQHDPQRSWKVRVKGQEPVDGFEEFNFINSPESVPFEEDIVLDIAREQGLLSPEYFPFRLLLNKSYMGVYFFEAQPDAALLRRTRRVPGSIYSAGEAPIDEKTGISTLFRSADHFNKVAQGVHQQLGEHRELETLINAINHATFGEFAAFADAHLDLDKFATFDALDVVFGCNQHDFADNHKYYFDPYRDRFEPVAWNFRNCRHEPEINRSENPLLLRLKTIPGYLARRNRRVLDLIHGAAAPDSLRQRTRQLLDKIQDDQMRDPFWDAHEQLPAMGSYYTRLRRPLTRALQNDALESRLHELSQRRRFLEHAFETGEVTATLTAPAAAKNAISRPLVPNATRLSITTQSESGYQLTQISPVWKAACTPATWRIKAAPVMAGTGNAQAPVLAEVVKGGAQAKMDLPLYPGVRFTGRLAHPRRGAVRAVSEARTFRLIVETDTCELEAAQLELQDLATDRRMTVRATPEPAALEAPIEPGCDAPYREAAGYQSPHPWCLAPRIVDTLSLGPGLVEITETREYRQTVTIAPGTTFLMGRDASLVFKGPVHAAGTRDQPIRFEPKATRWGGLVIMGPTTKGSRLSHIIIVGAQPASLAPLPSVAALSIIDTSEVEVDNCQLKAPQAAAGIQVVDGRAIVVSNTAVSSPASDGVVVQYSSGAISNVRVTNAGRNGIVVEGSNAEINRFISIAAKDDAASVGRASQATIRDSLLTGSKAGLFIHESSNVTLAHTLIYKNQLGVKVERQDADYSGKARVQGENSHIVGCSSTFQTNSKRAKLPEGFADDLPPSELGVLKTELLGIVDWSHLDEAIAQRREAQ